MAAVPVTRQLVDLANRLSKLAKSLSGYNQASAKYPLAPPGALSGGPNSGLQDPYVKAAGLTGCKPQKCFIDHSEAWSANEVTINWNAPLTWILAWTDEQAK